tara:strand:- start:538 stop:1659 length:1122 start_codon:yes stop_codon:yes gene_type:complete
MIKIRGSQLLLFLDKFFLILIFFNYLYIKFLRRRYHDINKKKSNIAIVYPTAIGDIFLSSKLFTNILNNNNSNQIYIFCTTHNFSINKIINLKFKNKIIFKKFNLFNPFSLSRLCKKNKINLVINSVPWSNYLTFCFLLISNKIQKNAYKNNLNFKNYLYDYVCVHSEVEHESYNLENLYNYKSITNNIFEINFKNNNLNDFFDIPSKYIVMHLTPGGRRKKDKSLPVIIQIKLIEYFINKGFKILITGSKSDFYEIELLREKIQLNGCVNICGKYSLFELMKIIISSELVISIDSGILHYTSFLKEKIFSIHGPTSSKRFGPTNNNSLSYDQLPLEKTYIHTGIEKSKEFTRCLEEINFDDLIKKIHTFLFR